MLSFIIASGIVEAVIDLGVSPHSIRVCSTFLSLPFPLCLYGYMRVSVYLCNFDWVPVKSISFY